MLSAKGRKSECNDANWVARMERTSAELRRLLASEIQLESFWNLTKSENVCRTKQITVNKIMLWHVLNTLGSKIVVFASLDPAEKWAFFRFVLCYHEISLTIAYSQKRLQSTRVSVSDDELNRYFWRVMIREQVPRSVRSSDEVVDEVLVVGLDFFQKQIYWFYLT